MKKYECSMSRKKEALTHRKAICEAVDYPTVKVGDTEWMSGYLDIDDGGPGIYEKDGMLYYTLPAALRVAKSLPGWRLPEGSDFDAIKDGDFRKIGLKDTGMADIEEKGGKYVPGWFGDETPYLMGTSSVFFRSFGSGATCRTGGHAAPVKLIKEAVPAHTYHTPLVKGEIWDFGNFNGSYWDEDHYKYGEMHRKVQKIVSDWTKKMKAEYPDVAEVVYARISEPWARQSCMLVDYVAPEAELDGLKKALEGTAVKLADPRGPQEITDDIYGGPKVGYYTRETKTHNESLSNYKGESKMKKCSMQKKIKEGVIRMSKFKIKVHESKKPKDLPDYQVDHGDECHIFIVDEPNYQVSFRADDEHEYTFYVQAKDPQDAIDTAYSEFGSHGLSVKGEGDLEDIPQEAEPVEVGINYVPKVNVAVDPYDGSRIRVVKVPEYYLPAMVNGDTSGMEEQDIKDYEEFEQSLIDDGLDPTSIFPVYGPDGEYWDIDSWGDVLCSTAIDK